VTVIPATLEAEAEESKLKASQGKVRETLSQKRNTKKRVE
jgi:hypothetical protein